MCAAAPGRLVHAGVAAADRARRHLHAVEAAFASERWHGQLVALPFSRSKPKTMPTVMNTAVIRPTCHGESPSSKSPQHWFEQPSVCSSCGVAARPAEPMPVASVRMARWRECVPTPHSTEHSDHSDHVLNSQSALAASAAAIVGAAAAALALTRGAAASCSPVALSCTDDDLARELDELHLLFSPSNAHAAAVGVGVERVRERLGLRVERAVGERQRRRARSRCARRARSLRHGREPLEHHAGRSCGGSTRARACPPPRAAAPSGVYAALSRATSRSSTLAFALAAAPLYHAPSRTAPTLERAERRSGPTPPPAGTSASPRASTAWCVAPAAARWSTPSARSPVVVPRPPVTVSVPSASESAPPWSSASPRFVTVSANSPSAAKPSTSRDEAHRAAAAVAEREHRRLADARARGRVEEVRGRRVARRVDLGRVRRRHAHRAARDDGVGRVEQHADLARVLAEARRVGRVGRGPRDARVEERAAVRGVRRREREDRAVGLGRERAAERAARVVVTVVAHREAVLGARVEARDRRGHEHLARPRPGRAVRVHRARDLAGRARVRVGRERVERGGAGGRREPAHERVGLVVARRRARPARAGL